MPVIMYDFHKDSIAPLILAIFQDIVVGVKFKYSNDGGRSGKYWRWIVFWISKNQIKISKIPKVHQLTRFLARELSIIYCHPTSQTPRARDRLLIKKMWRKTLGCPKEHHQLSHWGIQDDMANFKSKKWGHFKGFSNGLRKAIQWWVGMVLKCLRRDL